MSFRLRDIDPIDLAMDWSEFFKKKQIFALAGALYRRRPC